MRLGKNDYNNFLLYVINTNFAHMKVQLEKEDVSSALTSSKIGLDDVDMLALFYLLEDVLNVDLYIENVLAFWSVDAISEYLMKMDNEQISKIIENWLEENK